MIKITESPPRTVETHYRLGLVERTINFLTVKTDDGYMYHSIVLPLGKWDYDTIVNALISEVYPNDRMQATVNNYLADMNDATVVDEWVQMQNWRNSAKSLARTLLSEYE